MSGGSTKNDQSIATGSEPNSDFFTVKVALGDEKFTWECYPGFDLKGHLDSVNGSSLQWTNEKGNIERIFSIHRLVYVVRKYPDSEFIVVAKIPELAPAAGATFERPEPFQKRPSSLKSDDVKAVLSLDVYHPTCDPDVLMAFLDLNVRDHCPVEDRHKNSARAIIDALRTENAKTARWGMTGPRIVKHEHQYSALISEAISLAHFEGDKKVPVRWLHQMPVPKPNTPDERFVSTPDIVCCVQANSKTSGRGWFPFVIIECTRGDARDKLPQIIAYAVNANHMLPDDHRMHILTAVFKITDDGDLDVFVFACISAESKTLAHIPLRNLKHCDVENLSVVLASFQRFCEREANLKDHPVPKPRTVTCEIEQTMYKIFDRRPQQYHELSGPFRSAEHFPPERFPSLDVYDKDLDILKYRCVGTHIAGTIGEFVYAMKSLARLHDQGVVHGDIHGYNIVFAGDQSTVIDYDRAGPEKKTCYHFKFNLDLGDAGQRHPDALPGRPYKKEHDCYSFAFVMKYYVPEGPDSADAQSPWSNVIANLTSGSAGINDAIQKLEQYGAIRLRFDPSPSMVSGFVTGSDQHRAATRLSAPVPTLARVVEEPVIASRCSAPGCTDDFARKCIQNRCRKHCDKPCPRHSGKI